MIFRALILALLTTPLPAQVRLQPSPGISSVELEGVDERSKQVGEARSTPSNPAAPRSTAQKPLTPEQRRSQMLRTLRIDRSTSGILQARLTTANGAEEPTPQPRPTPANETPEQKKKREDQAKQAIYQKDFQIFSRDLVLGNWESVARYLNDLPPSDAQIAFARIVTELGSPVTVQPRQELAAIGARPHQDEQYFRPGEFFALTDASKSAPPDTLLPSLAKLIAGDRKPDPKFFATLAQGTRYFGTQGEEKKLRTARLLIEAEHLKESQPFLPDLDKALASQNHPALNLLARYHAEAHAAKLGAVHLREAWELSVGLISDKQAPVSERVEALYRALALVPELEGDAGSQWLIKTFANASTEGFEILAAVGTLAGQTRDHQSPEFRLEQLKLQSAAVAALTSDPGIDLAPWQEVLTLYVRNWNAEADRSYRLDSSTSLRPEARFDAFGNLYYANARPATPVNSRTIPAIASGDLIRTRPGEIWLAQIDLPVRIACLTHTAKLFLKVKEETRAFPILKQLAGMRPSETSELVREMIRVWAENNNPNRESSYRSRYAYFYGYNQRAETIPLTRSKQERNLELLAKIVREVRALGLPASFDEEFADAFIEAHSKAEVWRLEALTSVFGETSKLAPDTTASLVRRMRANLAGLWPDPKLQQEAKTNRKDKELEAQVINGYQAAQSLCSDALSQHPNHWALKIQLAALQYEESNYLSSLKAHPKHSTIKAFALEDLAAAAEAYTSTLPLEDEDEEAIEPFTTWFYAALGSPNLAALKAEHQPVPAELPKIKNALGSLPEPARERHFNEFARTLNARLANVPADLKFRYLEAALSITGDHEAIDEAARVFQYYRDLVTEIELDVHLDGPDRIDPAQPFGLYANLRHTREIERESGGFQRYLINQNNSPYSYNYGRPTEDYRDKFEKAARSALAEHFEVLSVTFHHSKVTSRTDAQPGWTLTPYAYFLLKAKGPQVDAIPPLKIDLDFLDTSGYVVLPITSAAIPVDASGPEAFPARPVRDLSLTMILDAREAEKEGTLALEIRATGHGLIPALEHLVDLPPPGFNVDSTDDRELQIEELDARTEDGAPLSSHEWRLVLTAENETLPASFTFPEVLAPLSTREDEGLTLQQYDDVDLVSVEATTPLTVGRQPSFPLVWLVLLALVGAIVLIQIFRPRKKEKTPPEGPALPSSLTPVSLLAFLESLLENQSLPDSARRQLSDTIRSLQDRAFGPSPDVPGPDELREMALSSLQFFPSS